MQVTQLALPSAAAAQVLVATTVPAGLHDSAELRLAQPLTAHTFEPIAVPVHVTDALGTTVQRTARLYRQRFVLELAAGDCTLHSRHLCTLPTARDYPLF